MSTDTTLSISLVFAFIAMIGTVLNIVSTIKSNNKEDQSQKIEFEKQFVRLNMKLDGMNINMTDLINRNDKNNLEIQEINKKLIIQNERIEYLFKDKENIESRLQDIENGRI